MPKSEYRSARRSRKLIREAFMELLQEKDRNKITVTDIVNRADINRTTFYAHYTDVRALLEEIENEIINKMNELLSQFEFHGFLQNPTPILLEISNYLKTDESFFKTLIFANGADKFMEKLADLFFHYMLEDAQVPKEIRMSNWYKLRTCYFAGGIINLYKCYFNDKLNCTLEDIANEVSQMLFSEAKTYMER